MRGPASVAFLLILSALADPAGAATVSGSVHDVTGAVISGAWIVVIDNQAQGTPANKMPGLTQRTDHSGSFQLTLAPGFYDLCAFSAGFSASCQKIYMRENSSHLNRKIKLSVDPLVMKERGDVFQ